MIEKHVAVNWFMGMSRECILNTTKFNKRIVSDQDIKKWSAFEVGMRDAAARLKTYYKPYDITKKGKNGIWYFDAGMFYLFIMANMSIIERVSDFKPLRDTMKACRDVTIKVSKIEASHSMTNEAMQTQAQELMKGNYEQLEMIWGSVSEKTPLNNMGVKKYHA